MRYLGDNLHEGDVILSNHPAAGGSHLPDLTVITPVSTALCTVDCEYFILKMGRFDVPYLLE